MSSLWVRVEPLLARVQKPARYIGCEDGAITPRHDKLPDGGTVAWLLAYPDTYEIGLPNQGLQILYEILNERDDAVAERTYAPWLDLTAELRRAGVPLFSVDTHRPAPEFDILDIWTGMGGPNDISLGEDGNFYIAEQEHDGKPAYVCVRDGSGKVITRLETRHVHGVGVDSRGDIYAGLTVDKSVDKFVRVS